MPEQQRALSDLTPEEVEAFQAMEFCPVCTSQCPRVNRGKPYGFPDRDCPSLFHQVPPRPDENVRVPDEYRSRRDRLKVVRNLIEARRDDLERFATMHDPTGVERTAARLNILRAEERGLEEWVGARRGTPVE